MREIALYEQFDSTLITLPGRTSWRPLPRELFSDVNSLFLIPLWILYWQTRWLLGMPSPPRAEFRIDADGFRAKFATDAGFRIASFACNLQDVIEIRKNRYEPGMWLRLKDIATGTYLRDLEDDTINQLVKRIHDAFSRFREPEA